MTKLWHIITNQLNQAGYHESKIALFVIAPAIIVILILAGAAFLDWWYKDKE